MTYTALTAKQLRTRGEGKYEKLAAEHALIDTALDNVGTQMVSFPLSDALTVGTYSEFLFPVAVTLTGVQVSVKGTGSVFSASIERDGTEVKEVVVNAEATYTTSVDTSSFTAAQTCSIVISATGSGAPTGSCITLNYTVA